MTKGNTPNTFMSMHYCLLIVNVSACYKLVYDVLILSVDHNILFLGTLRATAIQHTLSMFDTISMTRSNPNF